MLPAAPTEETKSPREMELIFFTPHPTEPLTLPQLFIPHKQTFICEMGRLAGLRIKPEGVSRGKSAPWLRLPRE